jgi:glycosyltransferase involved in cell wall biosynthesis
MADLNIVVSSYIEKLVRGQAPGTPVLVLPALIDTMIFRFDMKKARQFREKWSLGDIPIVAYLGGTQKFEGLSTLLQAARILVDEGSEFRILLAGETMRNRWHEDLPTRIHELKLENRVLFVGCLPTEEVVAAISASDVLVVPKQDVRANIAGFPQKLVEYLAAGKPVVATRVGDVPRYLTDRENALLCVPDDARALAQAISEPLHDKSLASYLGGAARKTAVQFFDVTVRTRDLVDALLACRIRSTKPHRALHQ